VNEGVSHFSARRFHDVSERLPGDAHLAGGIFLILPLKIGQAQSFQFIEGQLDLLDVGERSARRLENVRPGLAGHPAADQRPGHPQRLPTIIGIC
jgi:hypothetical protein